MRYDELKNWLRDIGIAVEGELRTASSDASFRRYFRLQEGRQSFIVMDAPPAQEDSSTFVRVAGYLEAMGLNAPRVIEVDLERGFLLLTDLGPTQYLDHINTRAGDVEQLYVDAVDALLQLQRQGEAFQSHLPAYDARFLETELSLFHDWLCGTHLGIDFTTNEEMHWRELCSCLIRNAVDQPQVFVHRDYHSRNLMLTESANPGILDFQDAMEGPLTYDLVSLLKDCYVRLSDEQVGAWAMRFYDGLDAQVRDSVGKRQFTRYFELMGVQRHLKAAGIFCRLNHRDGKPGYLGDIPRTLSYITELGPRYDELGFLVELISERILPAFEGAA